MAEPRPDIHELFCYYNSLYFSEALGTCILSWAPCLTSMPASCDCIEEGLCEIQLSVPLLKSRSSTDLKNILLHEMIHAFLWIIHKNNNHSDHGSKFWNIANLINSNHKDDDQRPSTGYHITAHHGFQNEEDTHDARLWMCASCGDFNKGGMNGEPSPSDCFENNDGDDCGNILCGWHRHKKLCPGQYEKVVDVSAFKNKGKSIGVGEPVDAENWLMRVGKILEATFIRTSEVQKDEFSSSGGLGPKQLTPASSTSCNPFLETFSHTFNTQTLESASIETIYFPHTSIGLLADDASPNREISVPVNPHSSPRSFFNTSSPSDLNSIGFTHHITVCTLPFDLPEMGMQSPVSQLQFSEASKEQPVRAHTRPTAVPAGMSMVNVWPLLSWMPPPEALHQNLKKLHKLLKAAADFLLLFLNAAGLQENARDNQTDLPRFDRQARQRLLPAEEIKDKRVIKRPRIMSEYLSSIADKPRSLGKKSSQPACSNNSNQLLVMDLRNRSLAVGPEIPRQRRTSCKKICNLPDREENTNHKRRREITLVIQLFGVYTDEESEEDLDPLINKRSERRKRMKLCNNSDGRGEQNAGLTPYEVISLD
ncbi:hypothetical protein IEQ34_002812 [Dendrobium chrysotoxum]|uniref:SprT-like domain-containing protein n=1 Tax=Dendrobium chrysotoxum TaxID=161865 RepID=A0AAV7HIS9_DENCH|nr:hypothetical protein IEQ34_002812 [Dendrobium chrysotoxum]